jgi:hypothetical protein
MIKFHWLNKKKDEIGLFSFSLFILFLPVCLIILKVVYYTDGVFIYPFDDTFIHLSIADNLIKGTWGVNQHEFASASSSVLYTLILAFVRIFSKTVLAPLIINCLTGIVIIVLLHQWLKQQLINYKGQAIIIFLVVLFTPLPLLLISGMEHTLQCLFSFLFIFYFSDWLEASNASGKRLPLNVLIFAVLTSTIRYEGLFLIFIACMLLLLKKKIGPALLLACISLAPLILFGLIATNSGGYFLPNSVLVKSDSLNSSGWLKSLYNIVFDRLMYARNGMAALATQRLTIIVPLLYFLFRKYIKPSYFFILVFLFIATIFQLSFAATGYLYRYEAYLFFCLMIIVPVLFYKYGKYILSDFRSIVSKVIFTAMVFFLFFPVVLRCTTALDKTAQASFNIFDQQYQMAMFVKKYYNNRSVALNDIGSVSYYTSANVVDLWGLANNEVTKSKKKHYWTTRFLDSLCRAKQVEVAIVYDSWFTDSLTQRWTKAATWQIQNNVICGDSIVTFYSPDAFLKDKLQRELEKFSNQLPASVIVKYY